MKPLSLANQDRRATAAGKRWGQCSRIALILEIFLVRARGCNAGQQVKVSIPVSLDWFRCVYVTSPCLPCVRAARAHVARQRGHLSHGRARARVGEQLRQTVVRHISCRRCLPKRKLMLDVY